MPLRFDGVPPGGPPAPTQPPGGWRAALRWIRRWRWQRPQRSSAPALVRLSAQPLTPRVSVHALRWGREEFLLACSDASTVLVARRPAEEPPAVTVEPR